MRRFSLIAIPLVLAGTSVACSESHGGDDAGIEFPDGAVLPDTGTPPPGPVCGNGELEPGEMCDDGNTVDDDSCNNECRRNGYCGDGTVNGDEVCDDGNNRSGDGCRSDCMSDESCNNGIVDYAAGEICDGSDGCIECRSVASCGDGPEVPPSEDGALCDDLNTMSFDGCDSACRTEIAMVIDALAVAPQRTGCDLTGDMRADNAFAEALGPVLTAGLGAIINQSLASGDLTMLLAFLGLEDGFGEDDADLRVAWLQGSDVDGDPANNYSGLNEFVVDPSSIDPSGAPVTSIQSAIAASMLTGGPEDIPLPLPIPIDLRQGRIRGNIVTNANGPADDKIQEGLLCGGVPASLLALFGGFLGDALEVGPACGGGEAPTLLDLMIAGGEATANFGGVSLPLTFRGTTPDLDLDADGLEGFRIQGGEDCQPVVIGCTDGDGTAIDGRGCFSDPRIADGYSAAFTFSAIRAQLVPAPTP